MIELQSAQSTRVSLESIRRGEGGLDEHRAAMLRRVPDVGDWASFPYEHLTMKDLAYLTAKTGHEFAILRGKHTDILFHGSGRNYTFDDDLAELLLSKQFCQLESPIWQNEVDSFDISQVCCAFRCKSSDSCASRSAFSSGNRCDKAAFCRCVSRCHFFISRPFGPRISGALHPSGY